MYGELGRYPLYVNRYVRIIKYWRRISSSDNIIVQKLYEQAMSDSANGRRNWVTSIRNLLNEYGFTFEFAFNFEPKQFVNIFKQRVIDSFIQNWFGTLNNKYFQIIDL